MKIERYGKVSHFLLVLVLFVFSLENHENGRLLLIAPIYLLFIFLYFSRGVNKNTASTFLSLSVLIFIISTFSIFSILSFKENMGGYDGLDFFVATLFKLSLVIVILFVINGNHLFLDKVLSTLIIIHIIIFYMQFVVVYATGFYIDLLYPFTGEASRYTWSVGGTYRPTGAFNEPSTYFAMVFPLIILRYYITGKIDKVSKYALISFFLSLSFAAIIVTITFLLVANAKGSKKYYFLPFIMMVIILMSPFVIDLYNIRTSAGYDAIGIRQNLNDAILQQPLLELFFGNGPAGVPKPLEYLYEENITAWAKNGFSAINDNGLFMFIIMKFGIIGVFLLLVFIYQKTKSIKHTILFLLILTTKIKLTSLIFIFVLCAIITISKDRKNEKQLPY